VHTCQLHIWPESGPARKSKIRAKHERKPSTTPIPSYLRAVRSSAFTEAQEGSRRPEGWGGVEDEIDRVRYGSGQMQSWRGTAWQLRERQGGAGVEMRGEERRREKRSTIAHRGVGTEREGEIGTIKRQSRRKQRTQQPFTPTLVLTAGLHCHSSAMCAASALCVLWCHCYLSLLLLIFSSKIHPNNPPATSPRSNYSSSQSMGFHPTPLSGASR
jgi:hypothetical protein